MSRRRNFLIAVSQGQIQCKTHQVKEKESNSHHANHFVQSPIVSVASDYFKFEHHFSENSAVLNFHETGIEIGSLSKGLGHGTVNVLNVRIYFCQGTFRFIISALWGSVL